MKLLIVTMARELFRQEKSATNILRKLVKIELPTFVGIKGCMQPIRRI